jgi:hypothetical protein
MNTLGKIVLGLLLACLLFATYLTTGALKARSSWLKKIGDKSTQIEQAQQDLASNKKQFEDARNLVHWENDVWGRAWQAPNSGPSPSGDGSVEFGIGSNAGLGKGQTDPTKLPVMYLFALGADGKPKYIGDFQLTEVRQDSAGAKLTRPLYADELQGWPSGEYRIREQVPHDSLDTIDTLRTQMILAEQTVAHEQAMLKIQNEHVAASQAALDQRLSELNGKLDAPDQAGPDVKDGLVQTLRREEASRNSLVNEVDQLRRLLSDKHLLLTNILADNQSKVQTVSAPTRTKAPANRVATQKAGTKNN